MDLQPKIKDALVKIDFINRYQKLSNDYDSIRTSLDNRLRYIDGEEIMDIIQDFGYSVSFEPKEKFFRIKKEKVDNYTFGFHIALDGGMVELIWVVWENEELLLGTPWSIYSRRLVDVNYRIKKPIISDYDDFKNIMKIAFEMYEDFKKAIVSKEV